MRKEQWFVVFAAILYGTITFGGQFFINLGLSAFELSIWSMLLMALILLPVVLIKPQYLIKRETLLFFAGFGLINALQEITQFAAISLSVPVAVVAFLLYAQPIWTIILGKLLLKEQITKKKIFVIAIAIFGIFLLLNPTTVKSVGSIAGIISAIVGGILVSLWIIFGKKSGTKKQHYLTTAFGCFVFSFFWLLVLWPILNFFIKDQGIVRFSASFPLHYWIFLIAFAVVSGVMPHLFFYRGVQKIQASIAGIVLLLEPVAATILAAIFFSQGIGLNIISGGALILISNYLVLKENS